jgi:hypothetical protein
MTVALFSAKARRAGVVLGAVSAGLLVLSACSKPTPLATVTVGTGSVHSEAACYDDGKALPTSELSKCIGKTGHTVDIDTADNVRFGVDPTIADNGWTIFFNGQPVEQQPFKKTYRSIPGSSFFPPDQTTGQTPTSSRVSIVETKNRNTVVGVWNFEFKSKS